MNLLRSVIRCPRSQAPGDKPEAYGLWPMAYGLLLEVTK
jgi:hypothetical protein